MKKIALLFASVLLASAPALADYPILDGQGNDLTVKSITLPGGVVLPVMSPVDYLGNSFGTSGNPFAIIFGSSAQLPPFAAPPSVDIRNINGSPNSLSNPLYVAPGAGASWNVVCTAGCSGGGGGGVTATYGGPIGTLGAPGGFKDSSGNFQSFLGDTTNGQWVLIKNATIGVTGTFWQTTQPVSIASMPTTPVTGTFWQTTQPVSAVTLPLPAGAATESGNLATIVTNTGRIPVLGQALATGSVPVVLTISQLATLTPPAAITGFALDASVVTTNTSIGAVGSAVAGADTGSFNLNALVQRNNQRVTAVVTALGTPFQAGGSIGNASFGVSGTLPAFAATPTFNLGTLNGAALATNQTAVTGAAFGGVVAANSLLVGGQYNSSPLTLTNLQQSGLQLDANGYLKVNVVVGGGGGGGATFGAAFPATGTAIGMTQGGNLVALSGTSGNLNVQCANCSGSGVSTADSATFTAGSSLFAGTGGFFQTTATSNPLTTGQQGMWQLTAFRAGMVNLRSAAGAELGVAAAPLQVSLANTAANGTSLLVTGTGGTFPVSQATASSLNATVVGTGTFAVQSTIATPAAWGINTLGSTTSGQSGQVALGAVTTAAPSYTTAQSNALSLTTVGALRVDGSAVTQPVSATQTGTWNVTNISGTITLPTGAATAALQPTNAAQGSTTSGQTGHLMQAAVTTANPNYTTAQTSPLSLNLLGELRTNDVSLDTVLGTTADAPCTIPTTTTACSLIAITKASANVGTTPIPLNVNGTATAQTGVTPGVAQTGTIIGANTDTTSIGGAAVAVNTGAVNAGTQRVAQAVDQATNAGAALVKGGVGVVSGGSNYETVAATITAQVLGPTGATGDYLSHCTVYPTSTSPGVVTVFDNTNATGTNVIAFPGGASSISNLVPFSFPVGAVSTAGPWKVTTGANLVVTCYGKFT